jgi:hypothetical protein
MKVSKWNLQYEIPFHLRITIQRRFSQDIYGLVAERRWETWDTLFLVTEKIKNGLMNEITTQ